THLTNTTQDPVDPLLPQEDTQSPSEGLDLIPLTTSFPSFSSVPDQLKNKHQTLLTHFHHLQHAYTLLQTHVSQQHIQRHTQLQQRRRKWQHRLQGYQTTLAQCQVDMDQLQLQRQQVEETLRLEQEQRVQLKHQLHEQHTLKKQLKKKYQRWKRLHASSHHPSSSFLISPKKSNQKQ
ncbi:hypothetical protein HMI54_004260, partial [Coelomomyces lativittatus]